MPPEGKRDSNEKREQLFDQFRQDRSEERRNALVESFLPLAEFFAKRYKDRGVEAEDLRQVAKLALVKAVDRFDPTHGVQFSTFAGRTIDGELKRHFRDKTWAVRVPRSLQESSLEVRRIVETLAVELGRPPTVEQIALRTGLDLDQVIEALDVQSSYRAQSIDGGAKDASESGRNLAATLSAAEDLIKESDERLVVERLLDSLPEREQEILRLRFYSELSQGEIAERVGLSQMHVSRLIRRSLEELRTRLPVE